MIVIRHMLAGIAAAFLITSAEAAGPGHCPPGKAKKGECVPAAATPRLPAAQAARACPPGLADKGCVPPGQAKKRYEVGVPLAADVTYVPVPVNRYPAPPPGTLYGQVDGDVLLIAEGTRKVIELVGIVDALSD